jgi:hypothetical protein
MLGKANIDNNGITTQQAKTAVFRKEILQFWQTTEHSSSLTITPSSLLSDYMMIV